MRVATLVLAAVLGAAQWGHARERPGAHPADDTQVFTGAEEVSPGAAARSPALRFWKVRATLTVPAATSVRIALLVPLSDGRQDVLGRRVVAPGFRYREIEAPPNLRAEWTAERTVPSTIAVDLAVRISETPEATLPGTPVGRLPAPPEQGEDVLAPSTYIQSAAPDVAARAHALVGKATRLDSVVWSLYQHTATFEPAVEPVGPQDALSVLAARRGTSLGRSRALVALLRAAGVPARLVGGLRLENTSAKRATNSWVEAWTGAGWFPLDPAGGHFGALPTSYLALYRGDLPLIVHTAGLQMGYGFAIRETTRRAVEEGEEPGAEPAGRALPRAGRHPVETHAAYVGAPVASVVLIADASVPAAATERILDEARAASIDCVLLTAQFESRYFRETYLERLVTANLPLIRRAHLVLVATADDAGVYALLTLGAHGIRMPDSRIIVAGAMPRATALMLGALLYDVVEPGEVVLVRQSAELLPLWEMARANLIDGVPMSEEAPRWGVEAMVLGGVGARLPHWRRPVLRAWASIVRAGVPLPALSLILILPLIATIAVAARLLIGLETFGMFGPVIVALAFVTTGLRWGIASFVVIVGLGVLLRAALQRLRLQAVARLAILIALVAAVMGGLVASGAALGIGPLLNLSIFPMVIISNVIENFAASQVELGTARALQLTGNTLLLSILCYLAVDRLGLQSLVVTAPEILLLAVALDLLLGKWRGMRLLELLRFSRAAGRPASPAAPGAS